MKTKAGMSLFPLSLIALVLMCGLAASAQDQVTPQPATSAVPNLIRYGGTLKDANGAVLASQTLGVTFALYKQQDGGVALWTETRNVTTNAAGQYSIMLGSTKPEGVTADLFSEQEQRWLGVQVQGQPEQSRVLMVSVPYAFQAHEAETLGGLPASAFVQAAPNATSSGSGGTGITVNGLSATSKAGNSTSSAPVQPPTVSDCLNPMLGAITLWSKQIQVSPPIWEICNSNLVQVLSGTYKGYIGIGTTMPSTALEVGGVGVGGGIITADNWYDITSAESPFLSIGWPAVTPLNQNTWLGLGAGGPVGTGNDKGTLNTFTGYDAGFENTAGSQNSCFGSAACLHNTTGIQNVAVGAGAGFRNDTGNNNTYVGFDAAFGVLLNDRGNNNTFTGWESGLNNTASNGSFYGYKAGASNTADGNSFYGFNSGPVNATGVQNVFMGYQTGLVNMAGHSNVFVGYDAGQANDQSYNTFVGDAAGFNSTAGGNTLIGYSAGSNTAGATGYGIVATGYDAGRSNTVGTLNAYYGVNAGFNGTTGPGAVYQVGSNNTYLGNGAGSSINLIDASNNIFVGFAAGNAENNPHNSIEIGNNGSNHYGDGSIQIGTQGVQTKLTYMQGIWSTLIPAADTPLTVVVGQDGHLGTVPGAATSVMGNCPGGLGYITQWSNPFTVTCSGIYQVPTGKYAGFIGIGTTNPSTALEVGGAITADTWYDISPAELPVLGIGRAVIATNDNLFVGVGAGDNNPNNLVTGTDNVFSGYQAGYNATGGSANTFTGSNAGYGNSKDMSGKSIPNTGCCNVFSGWAAGIGNTSGGANTFIGYGAGSFNQDGSYNTFTGYQSGSNLNTSGLSNSFYGESSGFESQCTGTGTSKICPSYNSFFGDSSGHNNTTGQYNTFLGYRAGYYNSTGNNNIYIGNPACFLCGAVNDTIVIGVQNTIGFLAAHTATYIAGIYPTPVPNTNPVCVTSQGQLGVCGSSQRFKENIREMGDSTSNLMKLRPVTYLYKPEYDKGQRSLQYGLIAEEVAKIYPDLVAYEPDGKPLTVNYQNLTAMLLNEFQKQHSVVSAQQTEVQALREQTKAQQQQMLAQQQEIEGLKSQLQLQNATFQERLSRLESLVTTQMQTAADKPAPATTPATGGLQ